MIPPDQIKIDLIKQYGLNLVQEGKDVYELYMNQNGTLLTNHNSSFVHGTNLHKVVQTITDCEIRPNTCISGPDVPGADLKCINMTGETASNYPLICYAHKDILFRNWKLPDAPRPFENTLLYSKSNMIIYVLAIQNLKPEEYHPVFRFPWRMFMLDVLVLNRKKLTEYYNTLRDFYYYNATERYGTHWPIGGPYEFYCKKHEDTGRLGDNFRIGVPGKDMFQLSIFGVDKYMWSLKYKTDFRTDTVQTEYEKKCLDLGIPGPFPMMKSQPGDPNRENAFFIDIFRRK